MKLKMAKNSLFAILLRSPWWISMAVVAVFALASAALLPPKYVVFGLMGAIPFLVIGGVAAYREMRAPSQKTIDLTLAAAAAMSWREFNQTLEQAYRRLGYEVRPSKAAAVDLELTRNAQTTLVSAKKWKAASHGIEPLRALSGARQTQDASHCIYVTLGELNDQTRRFAQHNTIELVNGAALVQLIGKLPAA